MGSYEVVSAIWPQPDARQLLRGELSRGPVRVVPGYASAPRHQRADAFGQGIRKVTEALQEKEMVITAIDRDITGTGHMMPFFRRPAPIPLGTAAIALRLGTPLLPVMRVPDARRQLTWRGGAHGDREEHRRPKERTRSA
jgi:hypothetical protein